MNRRSKKVFVDRDGVETVRRSFTFDEATLVGRNIPVAAQGDIGAPFTVEQLLTLVGAPWDLPLTPRYLRPTLEFLQQLVTASVLTEVHPRDPTAPLSWAYQQIWFPTGQEWAVGAAARALGARYVAQVYADVAVRVHVTSSDEVEHVASGVVVGRNLVVTNAHVVHGRSEVGVSWNDLPVQRVQDVVCHPDHSRIDLAVLEVSGFEPQPYPWMRAPRPGESVVTLAYPSIPRVEGRPLLRFPGAIVSGEAIKTYYGEPQALLSSVMSPGASGGPVFSADGYLVGLVVQRLVGHYSDGDSNLPQPSVYHAIIPGQTLVGELRDLHPGLELLNEFG